MPNQIHPSLSRRHFLAVCGVATAGLMSACGNSDESSTIQPDTVLSHPISAEYEHLFAGFEPADEPDGDPSMVTWPEFVTSSPPEIRALYEFHVTNGEIMRYMPCFCGCNASSGHHNNRDCYISAVHADGSVTFDAMAPT